MTVSSSLSQPKHSILWYRRIIEQGVRAGGAGPEGFQTEGYEYPAGYLVYGFDPHTLCQYPEGGDASCVVQKNFTKTSGDSSCGSMVFVL